MPSATEAALTALEAFLATAQELDPVTLAFLGQAKFYQQHALAFDKAMLYRACYGDKTEFSVPFITGALISFEGGDGSGKSTQTADLTRALQAAGHDAIATRAIGGAGGISLVLRDLILNPDYLWQPVAEALLCLSIYRETLVKVMMPTLTRGGLVVCDRWVDTALVYFQNQAAGLPPEHVEEMYEILLADMAPQLRPTLTFLLDLPYEEALQRRDKRTIGRVDRNENKGEAFHRFVFHAYRALKKHHRRIKMVDAQYGVAAITKICQDFVEEEVLPHVRGVSRI